MSPGSPLARGDVVLVRFPFTDLSTQKVRPAVVVARVSDDDVVLAFVTSQRIVGDPQASYLLDPVDPEFGMTGLKVASLVRLNRIATLHRSLVRRRLGRIGQKTEEAIARGLRYVFEL